MSTVTVLIGNSDNKLSQHAWSIFIDRVSEDVRGWTKSIYFSGYSLPTSKFQNAAWVVEIDEENLPKVRSLLSHLAREFDQDSIAMVVGETSLIKSRRLK